MSRKGDIIVIWPAYIDSQKTRSQGRMVPKSMTVDSPTADEIFEISKSLNLQPVLENSKRMPCHIWERPGRVLVLKRDKKLRILKEISAALQKKRAQSRK